MRPLAEALSVEERPRPRERLTAILLAFGRVGRRTVERLKTSPNRGGPAHGDPSDARVRRQRRAAGPHRAARRQRAAGAARGRARDSEHRHRARVPGASSRRCSSGTPAVARGDHAVARALRARRARHAALRLHPPARRPSRRAGAVYLRAIESLGALARSGRRRAARARRFTKASGGRRAAPRRSAHAAAAALARIGTPEAFAVLDEAARAPIARRPRGRARAAASTHAPAPGVDARRRA